MKIETRKIEEIKVRERKRGLREEKVLELEESISEIGLLHPIGIDNDNNLIWGYHRLEACKRLGWTEIPVIVVENTKDYLEYELMEIDENLIRAELTVLERAELLKRRKEIYEELHPETRKGYASLKNLMQFRKPEKPGSGFSVKHSVEHKGFVAEVSRQTGLSKSLIKEEIQIATRLSDEVKDMIWGTELEDRKQDLLAISKLETDEQKVVVERVLSEGVSVKKAITDILVERRKGGVKKRETKIEGGEFLLGDARELVDKLEDNSVDVIITDPPYGIKFKSNRRTQVNIVSREMENDNLDEALELIDDVLKKLERKLKDDGHLYLFCSWKTYPEVRNVVEKYFRIKTVLVWVKEDAGGIGDLDWWWEGYEMIISAVKKGKKPRPVMGKREGNVLHFPRLPSFAYEHPTQKPVELMEYLIVKTSVEGELIVDPFAGVGTTLLAAKKLNRKFWGCEIDEVYWRIGWEKLCNLENK